jgi:plastocyanin
MCGRVTGSAANGMISTVEKGKSSVYRNFAVLLASMMVAAGCSGDREAGTPAAREQPAIEAPVRQPGSGTVVGQVPMKGARTAFVILTPRGVAEVAPPDVQPVMDQVQMSFVPAILIARTGYPVQFRSSDEELHNVNVTHADTRQQEFNVAIPPDGKYVYTFKNTGLYSVGCDIHPAMSAQILVASTPWVAVTAPDGNCVFENVAPGAYRLTANAGASRFERDLQVTEGKNAVQFEAE